MEPLSTTSLRYFVAAADSGSFTEAARSIGISQPSLSVAIKKLEAELDTTLFVRDRRGIQLTATGQALLLRARAALQLLEAARNEVASLQDEPRGRFVIGAHESLAAYALPKFMVSFLEAYPAIRLSLWNGNSADVQRAVVDREVDIGLVVNAESQNDCVIQPMFDDRFMLMVASDRAHTDATTLLSTAPLVYVPVLDQVKSILSGLEAMGLHAQQHLPCSSMELVKSLVLDGLGVGILPRRVAMHGVAPGRLVEVPGELPTYEDEISLVRRFDRHETRASKILTEALKAHGRQMAAS